MCECDCSVRSWAAARQISGRRVACPPARRPRCELRSARRLEARPGPAGPAAASNRACVRVLALPPPTGTAAWPCRRPPAPRPGPAAARGHSSQVRLSQRRLLRSRCCLWCHGCSGRRRARPPARLGVLTSFGAAPRSPPVPSGPSGALHTGGACGSGVSGQAPRRAPIGRACVLAMALPPHSAWGYAESVGASG